MPAFLKRLWNGWRWIGHKIGHVNGIVILTVFYLLVITPYGWLVRRLGRDPVQTRIDPTEESYWQTRPTQRPPKSYERPF
jgi:hypothetical protein